MSNSNISPQEIRHNLRTLGVVLLRSAINRQDWRAIRRIGEELYQRGGIDLMRDTYQDTVDDDASADAVLDHVWWESRAVWEEK
jgi:hypothetical protein